MKEDVDLVDSGGRPPDHVGVTICGAAVNVQLPRKIEGLEEMKSCKVQEVKRDSPLTSLRLGR